MIPIAGYADRWSVGHNETIEFKVSSELNQPYSVRLVRMTCADPNPDGPGIIEHDLTRTIPDLRAVFGREIDRKIPHSFDLLIEPDR